MAHQPFTAMKSSGLKTTSQAVSTEAARLFGCVVLSDGTNAATLIIYDNASAATGTELAKVIVPAATLTDKLFFSTPVAASAGLYASTSGTGCGYIVFYR